MILTIKNQVAGTRSYLNGLIIVIENSQTTISRDLNVLLVSDAQFLADLGSNGPISIILNNGVKDLNPGEAIELAKVLAEFSTTPIATMPIYYFANVLILHGTGTSAGAVVWTMRNDALSTLQVVIERIQLTIAYDAATPALTKQTLGYTLRRFNNATTTGGSAITAVKMSNNGPPSTVTSIRTLSTGLTTTDINFEAPFASFQVPAVIGAINRFSNDSIPLNLKAGEGLAISLSDDALTGQSLYGTIVWSSR